MSGENACGGGWLRAGSIRAQLAVRLSDGSSDCARNSAGLSERSLKLQPARQSTTATSSGNVFPTIGSTAVPPRARSTSTWNGAGRHGAVQALGGCSSNEAELVAMA